MHASSLLKKWRTEVVQLTQAAAAKRLGLSQGALSDYESDNKSPDVRRALKIARLTNGFVPVESWEDQKRSRKRTGTDG